MLEAVNSFVRKEVLIGHEQPLAIISERINPTRTKTLVR
jgi:hypothetical protein